MLTQVLFLPCARCGWIFGHSGSCVKLCVRELRHLLRRMGAGCCRIVRGRRSTRGECDLIEIQMAWWVYANVRRPWHKDVHLMNAAVDSGCR